MTDAADGDVPELTADAVRLWLPVFVPAECEEQADVREDGAPDAR